MFTIADMKQSHLDAVYEIETHSFPIPWSKSALRKDLTENQHAAYKVAISKSGDVAGYAGLWHVVNEGQITNIAVAAPFRRMGVASLLLEALTELALEKNMMGLTLEVRISNTAAQKLYAKHGFAPEGIRKRYYAGTGLSGTGPSGGGGGDTREDAVIMWKYFSEDVI